MGITNHPSIEKMHSEILPVSMLATFLKINGDHLDEIAVNADGEAYTKQMLGDDAIKFAGWLLSSDLKANDTIAIVAPDSYESIAAIIGANAIGIKVIILDPIDESDVEPFYRDLDTYQPKMVLFYDKSSAWMSAVKSYAKHIKVFLSAKPIDPYTDQHFGFKNVVSRTETSFENTMQEIKLHKFTDEDSPMLYYRDDSWVSLLKNILNGKPVTLTDSIFKTTMSYRKLLHTVFAEKIS